MYGGFVLYGRRITTVTFLFVRGHSGSLQGVFHDRAQQPASVYGSICLRLESARSLSTHD